MPTDTKVETPRRIDLLKVVDVSVVALVVDTHHLQTVVQVDFALDLEAEVKRLTAELDEAKKRVKWLEDRVASMALDMDEMSQEER